MNKVISKEQLSEKVFKIVVEAPQIARARRAGHFVIVRVGEEGERVPLTIAAADVAAGTITLVVQAVGVSTQKLCDLPVGACVTDIVGPLGRATDIRRFGTVVCAGGGVGITPMLPIAEALKQVGNRVVAVLAGRTKELIILEKEVRAAADEVIIMTDDGSYGEKGLVTAGVEEVIRREKVDKCFAIGPGVMMKFVCKLTAAYRIPTDVSLNTIMVDGTGMCGACRVTVGGETKFVCVDGPEFDGHAVDFDEMLQRLRAYRPEEAKAYEAYLASRGHTTPAATPQSDLPAPQSRPAATAEAATAAQEAGDGAQPSRNDAWRKALRTQMKPKERMAIPRCEMDELAPDYRARRLREEVNRGLTAEAAQREAQRCLDCANPGCVKGCPVSIDIPRFIKHIEQGDFLSAARTLKETSALPAVCGRVCPQEKQCESQCTHVKTGGRSVAIGYLERFAADYQLRTGGTNGAAAPKKNGKKVAVVGSGPAGLSFAGEMTQRGYDVTVFEALHEIGGVLKYGIPEYRLPNSVVDAEIEALQRSGVTFVKDCVVGKTISVDELRARGYAAVFVASGAGLPNFMRIPGENHINILSSNEYLTRVNLMDASSDAADTPVPRGKHVVVVGGGNTAMDSVRTALRLGAETATIVYRRSEAEMPARLEEVNHAKEEGVRFLTLHNPLRYEADDEGRVKSVVLQKMRLGEPDASGRRRPVPVEGAVETLETDLVIVAVGVSPNPIVPHSVQGLQLGRKDTIQVDDAMRSSVADIYAGGDAVRGGATVILAMGDGKRAARAMDEQLAAMP